MAIIPLGQGSETGAQKKIDKSTVYVRMSLLFRDIFQMRMDE